MTRLARDQRGFTLVELLMAMLVLSFGIVATIGVFSSSKSASLVAQRHEVAIAQAQNAMEALRTVSYDTLALSSAPLVANRVENSSTKVGYYTGSGTMVVKSALGGTGAVSETLAVDSTKGAVNPAATTFNVGGAGISGKIYRYVTYRTESCPTVGGQALCPGTQQTKRILVAVTLDSNGRQALTRPVWIATITVKRNSQPFE